MKGVVVYLLYAVAIISLFISVRKKQKDGETQIFSKNDTLVLKGFAAIAVIFHHLGQNFSYSDPIKFNAYMGGFCVGIFFMLSSYGLSKSLHKKGYYKRIFLVKIPTLYLLQALMNTLYYLLFFTDKYQTASEILPRIFNVDFLFGLSRLNGFSWFITTILAVYVCFGGLLFLWEKVNGKLKTPRLAFALANTVLTALLYVIIRVTPMATLYGRSIFCFAVGVWVALFEKEIMQFLQKRKPFIIVLTATCVITVLSFFFFGEQIFCVAACLLTIVFFSKCSYPSAPLFTFLGKISLEIYLVQKAFFLCIPVRNEWVTAAIILTLTLLSAYLLHLLIYIGKRSTKLLKR